MTEPGLFSRFPAAVTRQTVGVGLLSGVIAGMAVFSFVSSDLLVPPVTETHLLIVMILVGGLVHPATGDLDESITAAVLGSFTGFVVHVIAFVSPAYLLTYAPILRAVLVPDLVGRATSTAILIYFMAFYSGYLLVVSVDGFVFS